MAPVKSFSFLLGGLGPIKKTISNEVLAFCTIKNHFTTFALSYGSGCPTDPGNGGKQLICSGSDVWSSPEFGHALPDSKDNAEQLTATAPEPGLGCHVYLALTVTHFLEQKGVTVRHSGALELAG